ncbi:unnamed protein product [Adineta ricciae]|uniref:receptor protein serine/threonine kinase n=1 Tax=Adineta ricciae TaxID=249248 RepID=A0A813YQ24_ADIRI|nr:unnamed protein product [Adineta ricciae]
MLSKTNLSLFVFINLINLSSALVCPTYLPWQQNASQYRLIKSCQTDCQFPTVDENHAVCLGIYSNYSGEIFIKQLGAISSDKQCLMSKQCILERDMMKSQTFTCCCSTDNCTLNWTSMSPARAIAINSTTINNVVIIEQEHFSWKLFLMIFIFLMIIILITFIFSLWRSLKTSNKKKNKTSFLKSPSSTSLMEQLFFSAQEIVIGKNSTVYKAIFKKDVAALKVYKQTNLLMWKNEVTILRSIKHESIIKVISEGQFGTHLYLLLPYYDNGTLQSYLRTSNRVLTSKQCLTFLHSLASAISYLHTGQSDIHMPIVHRDIKSSNVLVANDELGLCLADFGVATILPQVLTEKDFVQIGTMRYMAPELLEGVITYTHDALYSVDMYALALVFWEILMQCDIYPLTVYQAPYEEYLINNQEESSFASQIYDIVVIRGLRPTLRRQVNDKKHTLLRDELCSLIDACWTTDADMRMKAQTLVFKLNQVIQSRAE